MDWQTADKHIADIVHAQRPPVTYFNPDRKWFLPVCGVRGRCVTAKSDEK